MMVLLFKGPFFKVFKTGPKKSKKNRNNFKKKKGKTSAKNPKHSSLAIHPILDFDAKENSHQRKKRRTLKKTPPP